MKKVISKDGTSIAFDQTGSGLPVVLVCGGSTDRMANAALADLLAAHFTVFNYDRRGRGDSGDTAPYAVEREVEDIEAVIEAAGGSAFLYGTSSGAALALEAAANQLAVTKLALWEPPFMTDDNQTRPPANTAAIFNELVGAGRRGDAVEFFMTKVVGLPPSFAAFAHTQPWWAGQEALAHTLAYDATIMGDYSLPTARAEAVKVPTLVMVGGASWDWMQNTARTLSQLLPNGQLRTLEGQEHNVNPAAIAPMLEEFFR